MIEPTKHCCEGCVFLADTGREEKTLNSTDHLIRCRIVDFRHGDYLWLRMGSHCSCKRTWDDVKTDEGARTANALLVGNGPLPEYVYSLRKTQPTSPP